MLASRFARLDRRLEFASDLYQHTYRSMPGAGAARIRRLNSLEGLLSTTWQIWCGFCRDVAFLSCTGTKTAKGTMTVPVPDITSVGRMAYVASNALKSSTIRPGKELAPFSEPTWGDPDVMLALINEVRPTNINELKSGLMLPYVGIEHMRIIRNATAHYRGVTNPEIERIKIYYYGSMYRHPLDLLDWHEASSRELVFVSWIGEILEMAENMTQ